MPLGSQDTRDLHELAALAIGALLPREQRVLKMRFGIDGDEEHSHVDIARVLHISQSNVAAIEARALRKMRSPLRLLSNSHHSIPELQRAITILARFQEETVTPEDVANKIKTELPELSSLADSLPKTRNELYAFIQSLVLILTLAVGIMNYNQRGIPQSSQTTNVFITRPQAELVIPKSPPGKKSGKSKKKRLRKHS